MPRSGPISRKLGVETRKPSTPELLVTSDEEGKAGRAYRPDQQLRGPEPTFDITLKPNAKITTEITGAALNESKGPKVASWIKKMLRLKFLKEVQKKKVKMCTKH